MTRRRRAGGHTGEPPAAAAGGSLGIALASLIACGPGAQAPARGAHEPPQRLATAAPVVLDFPEPALDDPAAYAGYRTRFFRDAAGNTFQIYIAGADGRAVSVWANGANESLGFTARDPAGTPVAFDWGAHEGRTESSRGSRSMEYQLRTDARDVRLGLFVLGTMRFERDLQYQGLHRLPLDVSLPVPELVELAAVVDRLDGEERARHLRLLRAADAGELRDRLEPELELHLDGERWRFRARQPGFDARGELVLELSLDVREAEVFLDGRVLAIRARTPGPLRITVTATTDAPALTPLTRAEIFEPEFLRFLDSARVAREGLPRRQDQPASGEDLRYRRLERQVVATELLTSREKLMAGLPNFGTYFGRDMLMTALMMEAVWAPSMAEHVIASALRKLDPNGDVSHEEALGAQAVREAAAEYVRLLEAYLDGGGTRPELLAAARAELGSMAAPRENHRMVDDDFQLPIVVARWLADPRVTDVRKRTFLLEPAGPGLPDRRELVLRNLGLVARRTAAYAQDPRPEHLISFPRNGEGRWFPGSWRDSGPGYGNGRYALDVNAIWAPHALAATASVLDRLSELGLGPGDPDAAGAGRGWSQPYPPALERYRLDRDALRRSLTVWRGAAAHFVVELPADSVRPAIEARLAALPADEGAHWRERLLRRGGLEGGLRFLALALDSVGRPVPVLSSDPAMGILLGDLESAVGEESPLEVIEPVLRPYPVGLMVEGVGPLVSNDAYASPAVWAAFDSDPYHSPRTVWGREVNLVLLGLAHRIREAHDDRGHLLDASRAGEVRALRDALDRVRAAVDDSGLKHHELWSFRMGPAGLEPARFGTSTDIQLWNATDLAVQYALSRLPPAR